MMAQEQCGSGAAVADDVYQQPREWPTGWITIITIAIGIAVYWYGWRLRPMPEHLAVAARSVAAAAASRPPMAIQPTVLADAPPQRKFELTLANDGAVDFGGVVGRVIHRDAAYQQTVQGANFVSEAGGPRTVEGVWELPGKWTTSTGTFDWRQTVEQIDANTWICDFSVQSASAVDTQSLEFSLSLPVSMYAGQRIMADGKEIRLEERLPLPSRSVILDEPLVQRIEIATLAGHLCIDGPARLTVQDNRAFGTSSYSLRLGFTPGKGMIRRASLRLTVRQMANDERSHVPAGKR